MNHDKYQSLLEQYRARVDRFLERVWEKLPNGAQWARDSGNPGAIIGVKFYMQGKADVFVEVIPEIISYGEDPYSISLSHAKIVGGGPEQYTRSEGLALAISDLWTPEFRASVRKYQMLRDGILTRIREELQSRVNVYQHPDFWEGEESFDPRGDVVVLSRDKTRVALNFVSRKVGGSWRLMEIWVRSKKFDSGTPASVLALAISSLLDVETKWAEAFDSLKDVKFAPSTRKEIQKRLKESLDLGPVVKRGLGGTEISHDLGDFRISGQGANDAEALLSFRKAANESLDYHFRKIDALCFALRGLAKLELDYGEGSDEG